MEIYHYNLETGQYLGCSLADESPLEPGIYLIPAHATNVAPPEIQEGMQAVIIEGTWKVLPIPSLPPEPELPASPETVIAPTLELDLMTDLTPLEKLNRLGLTVYDLKALLTD